ncbi:MAG: tRNA epoxyqueuosine(34) reductase QueG [Planctomycetota bacterium]
MSTDADGSRAERVRAVMLDEGFGLCGVCRAEPSGYGDFFGRWLAEGRHGEMGYLAEHADKRLDVRRLIPEDEGGPARAVVVVADGYEVGAEKDEGRRTKDEVRAGGRAAPSTVRGRLARYAAGDDYHVVMKKRLHAAADRLRAMFRGEVFKACVDTAPLMEREHAARAGLGWIGKHTLLIHPRHGSYLFLGALVTSLDVAGDAKPSEDLSQMVSGGGGCGTCTRCIDACPTGCITPYSVDASRCISYLTIEHRSDVSADLRGMMGDWLAGCDVCQEVCPWNGFDEAGAGGGDRERYRVPLPVRPAYRPRNVSFDVAAVECWSAEDRASALRGSALKRIKLPMWRRNAAIVAENAQAD